MLAVVERTPAPAPQRARICEFGIDLPEILHWQWTDPVRAPLWRNR